MHDNTKRKLIEAGLYKKLNENKKIKIIKPLSYIEFIFALKNCKLLVADGGSIQEESLIFKKPCILLRNKTERQEGLDTRINFLTGLDVEKTKRIFEKILDEKYEIPKFENPYGQPGLTKKIVGLLK